MIKLYKKLIENKFFLKNLLLYSLIIVIGVGLTAFFIISTVIDHLINVEAKYEREILEKVMNFVDDKFKSIDKIFSKLYFRDYFGLSIADLLNPKKNKIISNKDREQLILSTIQNLCYIYNFITDITILDYNTEEVFFYSNVLNRYCSVEPYFFQTNFVLSLKKSSVCMGIIPNNIPPYIKSYLGRINLHVISVYINLLDLSHTESKLGAMIINIDPQIINESLYDVSNTIKGKILITDKSGFVIFDSSNELTNDYFIDDNLQISKPRFTIKKNDLVINKLQSTYVNFNFFNIINKREIYSDLRNIVGQVFNIIIVCIGISILITIFVSKIFMRRINKLTKAMHLVESGNFKTKLNVISNDEIGYLEKSFNNMCLKLEEYIKTVYISNIKIKTSELKALQAQINPHFIFNTLESIRLAALMNNDKETAKMIHILGNLFRWNIKKQDMIVEISDEIDYVTSYIELQKIRYTNRFELEFDIQQEIYKYGIPKLLLQPLIENAIHHGISGKPDGEKIIISGRLNNDRIEIEIEDHGVGIPHNKLKELKNSIYEANGKEDDIYNIGLRNVHQRIKLLFGDDFGLDILSTVDEYTVVKIIIPALKLEEMKNYVQGLNSRR